MWMHVDSFSYSYNYAGAATADSPLGPFVWAHATQPNGYESYDLQIWWALCLSISVYLYIDGYIDR